VLNKTDCVGTRGDASTDSVGEAAEFVGAGMDPFCFVRSLDELGVFHDDTGKGIDDRIGEMEEELDRVVWSR
jgi:hypothetical protein